MRYSYIILILLFFSACDGILSPQPVDRITNDQVLDEPGSARAVVSGIYRSFANLAAPKVVAGDLTADLLTANGTFTQYIEIGNKTISASNGAATAMWNVIYDLVFKVNFLFEGIDDIQGLVASERDEILAEARFLRAYAYFTGAYTYGGMPIVETTDIATNSSIGRSSREELLAYIESELLLCLDLLPEEPFNSGFASNGAVKALLARYYLYVENYEEAERLATEVIDANGTFEYTLEQNYLDAISDFSQESILEVVYSANDNPGTSTNFSLWNLFEERREIIPSGVVVSALQNNGGERLGVITFDANNVGPRDNGYTITRYGQFDNVPVFRLAEMYLIRSEARTRLGRVTGVTGGLDDLNTIRVRSDQAPLDINSASELLSAIEEERLVEFAFEGHRWYDIKRTGKAATIMNAFTPNWSETDNLWPIPLREITNNPSLRNAQNPGY